MRIGGMDKLRIFARRLRHRFAPGGVILLYHRVAEVGSDPWSLCVTPRHFAEHLEVLRKHGHPVQLQQLAQTVRDGKRPHQQVAVTFDDGYADNLHNAKPLLEQYDIPATVFLTTGYIGQEREFWWDELDKLLLQPGTLPEALQLSVNGSIYRWELGESAHYSEDAHQHHRDWNAMGNDNPNPRHSLYRSLYQLLRPLVEGERRQVLDELLVWANAEPVSRSTHRLLTTAEVSTLEQGGAIEVGAHTVSHPFLSALPAAAQREEIKRSKASLEDIVGHSVRSFAYPYGNYTAQTPTLVQEAGFACACSTVATSVRQRSNCFELPRVVVEDWDGEEFARRLQKWLYV